MRPIRIAHSPDSDDAFMFYALATGRIKRKGLQFIHELHDIETLNQAAVESRYEVTAVSIHAYAYLHEQYALMNSGASMGEGYGPVLVARDSFPPDELAERNVAVPGRWTSAYLALQLFCPGFRHCVLPFDQILPAVTSGEVDAGLLIHEGQLFYSDHGLRKIVDLGEWWLESTGLPLPLGGNVIRRNLGGELIHEISDLIRQSIRYSLDHRQEALQYALQFGRGLDSVRGDRFVGMYVNSRTLDYGEDGRRAVQVFLDRGFNAGLIPHPVQVEFV